MNPVFLPWIAEIGIITYRALTGTRFTVTFANGTPSVAQTNGPKRPPLPSEILSTFIIFGAYSLIGEGEGERRTIASLLGWGTVLATVLMMANKGTPAPNAQTNTSPVGPVPAKTPATKTR